MRSDADRGDTCQVEGAFHLTFDGHGSNHALRCVHVVHSTPFDPEPTLDVEVPHVARSMPALPIAEVGSRCPFGGPEAEVAIRDPGGIDNDLSGDTGIDRSRSGCGVEIKRQDHHRGTGNRTDDTDATCWLVCGGSLDAREIDVGHREDLGHAVWGVHHRVRG